MTPEIAGSNPVVGPMLPWCNWLAHYPVKVEAFAGSSPVGGARRKGRFDSGYRIAQSFRGSVVIGTPPQVYAWRGGSFPVREWKGVMTLKPGDCGGFDSYPVLMG